MSEFKLRVSIGSANIELEGESELVNKFFTEIRENGLGKLADFNIQEQKHITLTDVQANSPCKNLQENYHSQCNEQYPSIQDIVLKNNVKTESDWVLVYAFYASNYGTKAIAKKEIKQMYKVTNRYTKARDGNFVTNIKKLVTSNFISALNDTDFIITDNGKAEITKILGIN